MFCLITLYIYISVIVLFARFGLLFLFVLKNVKCFSIKQNCLAFLRYIYFWYRHILYGTSKLEWLMENKLTYLFFYFDKS